MDGGYPIDEEAQEAQEDYQEALEEQQDYSDYPMPKRQDNLFNLFRDVIRLKDSSKTSNLDPKTELGKLDISARAMVRIVVIAEALKPETYDGIVSDEQQVADFFKQEAEKIALSLTLSKNGFLDELFVSQKKFTTKTKAGVTEEQMEGLKKGWRRKA